MLHRLHIYKFLNPFILSFIFLPLLPVNCRCKALVSHLITLRHTHTLGRTPLDEGSTGRCYLYLTTHNTHNKHPCHWKDSNPQSQQASDRSPMPKTARPPGIGKFNFFFFKYYISCKSSQRERETYYLRG